jgi:hypothetical protein
VIYVGAIEGTPENRRSNFNLIDLILLSKLGERRRQNGDRISILYSILLKSTGYLVKMILAKTSLVFYNKSIGMGTLMALD